MEKITLLKFPRINETATGSSTKDVFIIFPIPSYHGISFIILSVMGLDDISKVRLYFRFNLTIN